MNDGNYYIYDTYMAVCPAVDPLSSTKNQGCHIYIIISQHLVNLIFFLLYSCVDLMLVFG